MSQLNDKSTDSASQKPNRPWLERYPFCIPATLEYPQEPMWWLLERAATEWPDRDACRYYQQSFTFSELLTQARALGAYLVEQGIEPGDRIGLLLPNTPEFMIALNAVWMAGGTAVALSPLFVAEEAEAFVKVTDCKIVITLDVLTPLVCGGEHRPGLVLYSSLGDRLNQLERLGYAWVRLMRLGFTSISSNGAAKNWKDVLTSFKQHAEGFEPVRQSPSDRAYILPTGGTTSHPKAVVLTHGNLMANAWQLATWSGNRQGKEVMMAVLPFFHSYGLSSCLTSGTVLGATLILHHRFRPTSVIKLIQEHKPSVFPAVPAMMAALNRILRKSPVKMDSIKAVISGGAPLPHLVAEEFSERTGAVVVEGYGLSEASPVTHAGPLDGTAIPGTIGFPLPDTDAKIVDAATGTEELPVGEVGELVVKGPQVMQGYWQNPEATAEALRDGWLHTGDLASCDEQGYFRIVDRKKDLIITGGFNVYPADVEEVLRDCPGVKDVAVVGVPDEDKGELVKAVVVMEPGQTFHKHELESFSKQHLSAYKRPRIFEECQGDLPRNFLGKVLRRELRDGGGQVELSAGPDAN